MANIGGQYGDKTPQASIEDRSGAMNGQFPSVIFAPELIPQRWRVVEDVTPSDFQVEDLEFITFLREGETAIGGERMRQRAVELRGNFGLVDGKKILAEQEKIPIGLQRKYFPLFGTLLRNHRDCLCMPFLVFVGGRWVLLFNSLDAELGDFARLARLKSV